MKGLLLVTAPLLGALLTVSAPAWATAPGGTNDDNLVSYERPDTERRGGFTVGLSSGLSLVDFSGYPNRVAALGDPAQEIGTGSQFGSGFGFWVGGALRDWITVGVGLASSSVLTGDYESANAAFVLHLELYPLYFKGGPFRDLGLAIDGGPGFAQTFAKTDKARENILADGGSMSFLAASLFFEPFRFWQMSTGPSITLSHSFSQSFTANQASLGWRIVFYGDQPRDSRPRADAAKIPGFAAAY